MNDSELTTTLLRDIRDQMTATRVELKAELAAMRTELKAELAATRTELAATRTELKAELAQTRTELGERIDVTNDRLAIVETTVRDCAQQLVMLGRYVKNRTDRHETAIDDLRERVTRLENK